MTRPHPHALERAAYALIISFLLIVIATIATSCITATRTGSATQPSTPAYVEQLESVVRTDVRAAVGTYIVFGKTDAEKSRRAAHIAEVAGQVKAAADQGVDISDLTKLAEDLALRNLDADKRLVAEVLLNSIVAHVKLALGLDIKVTLIPPTMLPEARRLIGAAAEESESTARTFLH